MQAGDRFDRYVIEGLIGRGGMGEVYVARDESLRRRVALKILRDGGAGDTGAHARLLDEARAVAAFEHPHVVRVFDVGESNGVPFLAMELVEGRPLRAYVGDASVTMGERAEWLVAIGRALAAAHARGVVHRDVKPENVIVGADRVVKVLDFGIARRLPVVDREAISRTVPMPGGADAAVASVRPARDGVRGTLAYMAPEQVRGEPVEGAADQWAWGVVAYELFAGERPWDTSKGALITVSQIVSHEPVPLQERVSEVPRAVSDVVQRALRKTPGERFPTMSAAVDALDAARVSEAPIEDPPARPMPQAPVARSRVPTGLLGALLAAATLGGVMHFARAPSSEASSATAATTVTPPPARFPDFGSPMSTVPLALASYRQGMQAMRDAASFDAVLPSFDRAIAADPNFAAAYLRKALAMEWLDDESREAFFGAQRRRDRLGPHDRALLEAIEPWYRVPHDTEDLRARLGRLSGDDSDFDLQRCSMLLRAGLAADARDACRDAEDSDATLAAAYFTEGRSLMKLGDASSAREAFDACLARSQEAARCVESLARNAASAGRCDEFADSARRLVVLNPKGAISRHLYAQALFAQAYRGRVDYAAFDMTLRASADESAGIAEENLMTGQAAAFVARGELDEAARMYEQAARAYRTPAEDIIAGAYLGQLKVLAETGRVAQVVALARRWLAEREGWTPSAVEDSRILPLGALYVAGALPRARFIEERTAWLERERRRGASLDPYNQWADAYGKAIVTVEDAQAALEGLSSFAPLPPAGQRGDFDEALGLAYLRAGRAAEAVVPLRGLTSACLRVSNPVPQIRGLAALGEALAEVGDTRGACEAWEELLRHWGSAKSSLSVSLSRAQRRRASCSP